jgi:hypothetical protein
MRSVSGVMVLVFAVAFLTVTPVAAADSPASPLPQIGTTRSRPLCTAVRQNIAPAVAGLMRVDARILAARKTLGELAHLTGDPQANLKLEGDKAKDLQRMRLAVLARGIAQDLSLVKGALATIPTPSPTTSADDRLTGDLRAQLTLVASRQQDALNDVNGLVETELQGQMRTEFDSHIGPQLPNGDRNPPLPPPLVGSGLQMKDPVAVFDQRRQLSYDTVLGHTLYDHVAKVIVGRETVIASAERAVAPTIERAAHACNAPNSP